MAISIPASHPPNASRRAAFFDVDGTLTNERTWKGLLEYFRQRRLRRATLLAFIAMHYPLYLIRRLGLISESAFRSPWAAHLAWFVRGYSVEEANEVWEWTVTHFINHAWRTDILRVLEDHRQAGHLVIIVSSGPQPLMARAARDLQVEHVIGTRFELDERRYTGRSLEPICIDEFKASLTLKHLQNLGIQVDLTNSFAYADSTADLSLLEMVGNPVAVYPDKNLEKIAYQRGWQVIPNSASADVIKYN